MIHEILGYPAAYMEIRDRSDYAVRIPYVVLKCGGVQTREQAELIRDTTIHNIKTTLEETYKDYFKMILWRTMPEIGTEGTADGNWGVYMRLATSPHIPLESALDDALRDLREAGRI